MLVVKCARKLFAVSPLALAAAACRARQPLAAVDRSRAIERPCRHAAERDEGVSPDGGSGDAHLATRFGRAGLPRPRRCCPNSRAVLNSWPRVTARATSFAIRQGAWKLIFCGDAGTTPPTDPTRRERPETETDGVAVQLFDLSDDVGEQNNLADQRPDVIQRLTRLMERYVREDRSTPGVRQNDDVRVEWERSASMRRAP